MNMNGDVVIGGVIGSIIGRIWGGMVTCQRFDLVF
jgi:hypothetical protein